MSRIAPIPPDSPQMQDLVPLAAKGAKGFHVLGTILRNQELYDAWRPLARYFNASTCITRRERELVILRTAWLCGSDYEWGNHVLVARDAGLADEEIGAIRLGTGSAGWSEQEAALLGVPDDLVGDSRLSERSYQALATHYNEAQIIEILMLVGHYVMVGYLLNSVGTEREDGVHGLDHPPGNEPDDR
jgi:4-carboxymuconolactone decarboxylase